MDIREILGDENEKPLDRLVTDGGFVGIFRTICCVGDSLSSGEFEIIDKDGAKKYLDFYDYSWGQYLGRMAGSKVYNFSRGGMTAREYCEGFANANNFWSADKAANAYIIALGCNDLLNRGEPLGDISDIKDDWRECDKTFMGYYAQIIMRYKEIQPEAKFFLVTFPEYPDATEEKKENTKKLQKAIYELAEHFSNCYVIDLYKYSVPHDKLYQDNFQLLGHLNPMGYLLSARIIASYIDYIIRHNMKDFKFVGLMGVEHTYAE